MKPNLKDFPKEMLEGIDYSPTAKKLLAWFEGFEKELRKYNENFGEEIEALHKKFSNILKKRNRPRLNEAEGFNGFVIGYRLARKEILGDSEASSS